MILKRLVATLVLAPGIALAGTSYDRADVVRVEPVYETVAFSAPVERCADERVRAERPRHTRASATGPILGAIIGGALGNAVGHNKRNKQVGAVVGAVLGGSVGADISRRNASRYNDGYDTDYRSAGYRTQRVCHVVNDYREEERLAGYDVTYRYAGANYVTRMNRDPGDAIRVRVTVSPAS